VVVVHALADVVLHSVLILGDFGDSGVVVLSTNSSSLGVNLGFIIVHKAVEYYY
jgi:hypothetical protein